MIETLTPILISFFGLLSAIVVWFQLRTKLEGKKLDNAKELEDLKAQNQGLYLKNLEAEIGLLHAALATFKMDVDTFKNEMLESVSTLKIAAAKYSETQEKADRVIVALGEHHEWINSKFKAIDSIQTQQSAEITKLFGKVVIKE